MRLPMGYPTFDYGFREKSFGRISGRPNPSSLKYTFTEDRKLTHAPTQGTQSPLAMIMEAPPSPLSSFSSNDSVSSLNASPYTRGASMVTEAFLNTKSRVLRLSGLLPSGVADVGSVFSRHNLPLPASLWTLFSTEEPNNNMPTVVWAVFQDHEEAYRVLTSTLAAASIITLDPALESDLNPPENFKLLQMIHPDSTTKNYLNLSDRPRTLYVSSSNPELCSGRSVVEANAGEYTLSTNPPNPRTAFRLGDWICSFQNCAAHNFGRNTSCIGCTNPRLLFDGSPPTAPTMSHPLLSPSRPQPSPRFTSSSATSSPTHNQNFAPLQQQSPHHGSSNRQPRPISTSNQHQQQHHHAGFPQKPTHPLLTPSGRTFAEGGKVQNVSSDPLVPCILYWPDNEPFPEQGQIRPGYLSSVSQPPILNTGNRGPISHQPGDWICTKCNYLNWRRRKVCQTCLPYAEGNGDSISAAVQTERIALLSNVLAQTDLSDEGFVNAPTSPNATNGQRSQSFCHVSEPPRRPFMDQNMPMPVRGPPPVKSKSQFELGSNPSSQYPYHISDAHRIASPIVPGRPIYQTSGCRPLHAAPPSPSPISPLSPRHNIQQQQHSQAYLPNVPGSSRHLSFPSNGSSSGSERDHALASALAMTGALPSGLVLHSPAPAPLLPGFLQDMIKSPTLSPSSTSSADLSVEEVVSLDDHDQPGMTIHEGRIGRSSYPHHHSSTNTRVSSTSSSSSHSAKEHIQNIWRLDGVESRSLHYPAGGMTPPQVLAAAGVGAKRHLPLEIRQHSPVIPMGRML